LLWLLTTSTIGTYATRWKLSLAAALIDE
jgi:hypothetical protein